MPKIFLAHSVCHCRGMTHNYLPMMSWSCLLVYLMNTQTEVTALCMRANTSHAERTHSISHCVFDSAKVDKNLFCEISGVAVKIYQHFFAIPFFEYFKLHGLLTRN